MFQITEDDLYVILNNFYSTYFVNYLEEVLADEKEEYSAVTLFQGMNYFMGLCANLNIQLHFRSIEEYMVQNYENGTDLYGNLNQKYLKELNGYQMPDLTFQEKNSIPEFLHT